ncbi:LysR family transcriptional regulator [Cohnella abietis]|uniref:HTH-type transcriptional regulator YtlI n=1 Tax=Cohnella abietis TaxID=2507935 RepID=A0A3T1DBV3_9BACL|nr:LysR family transcriptional regulator [Cohnella abietis]BBI35579.1 HTH-type transcriptional regulator YtlI [Cohnella abietis]
MEFRMIKTFQTIVKLGSFLKAAEALQYAQPTITLHIQKLESDLGVKLLERGKQMRLTEAGMIFYQRANKLLQEFEYMNSTINDLVQGEAGLVRIGISEPTASNRMPVLLTEFKNQYPKLQLQMHIGDAKRLKRMVSEDLIDFAICTEPEANLETTFEPLFFEPLALLVRTDHPFAKRKQITIKDLQGENLLLTAPDCPIRLKIQEALLDKMEGKLTSIEIGSINAHKSYVQAGMGVSISPVLNPPLPNTTYVTIADLKIGPQIGIIRKRDAAPIGLAGSRLLQEITRKLPLHSSVIEFQFPASGE